MGWDEVATVMKTKTTMNLPLIGAGWGRPLIPKSTQSAPNRSWSGQVTHFTQPIAISPPSPGGGTTWK